MKIKLNSEEFVSTVVDYMLREFDADYQSVKKKPRIKNVDWYEYYWDSPETKKEFLDWLKKFLKTKVNYSPYKIDNVVSQIDLMWGLKVYEDDIKK